MALQVHPDLFLNRTSGQAPTALSKKSGLLIPTDDNVSLKVLHANYGAGSPTIGEAKNDF